jgi:phosphoribosyl 1,2-cyclic phosphate phosphodiesterase
VKITFLGTGTSQGVPVIACKCATCQSNDPRDKRLRASILVEHQDMVVIIDTGPDFRQQMLSACVDRLDAVIFTHEHRDHIAGLDDIRAYNFLQDGPLDVYGEDRVLRALQHTFPYIFAERKYPGIPQVNFHHIENELFSVGGLEIMPVRAYHYRLPVLGYRIGDFTYITDANFIAPEELEKIRGTRYFVLCALRKRKHISHYSLSEALEVIKQVGPEQAYLTHVSHLMGSQAETSSELPANVSFAWDGLSFKI